MVDEKLKVNSTPLDSDRIGAGHTAPRSGHAISRPGRIPTVVNSRILFLAAMAAAPVLAVLAVHRFGVNVPWYDEWDTLSDIISAHDGHIVFYQLWRQHMEHRILLVRLAIILLARLTHYDLRADMYCGLGFEFVALILVWRMLSVTLKAPSPGLIKPLAVSASALLFWTAAWENWFFGIASLEFFGSVMLAMIVVWLLVEWPGRWIGVFAALLTTFAAICTGGTGFPLFAVVLAGILVNARRQKRKAIAQIAAIVLPSVPALVFFFKDYSTLGHSFHSLIGRHPLRCFGYFVVYLGSPFTPEGWDWLFPLAMGLVSIAWVSVCAVWIARRRPHVTTVLPWMLLAFYAVLNAALTSIARIDYGFDLDQATTSRYRSIAVLLWLSCLCISAQAARDLYKQGRRRIAIAATTLFLAAALPLYCHFYWVNVHVFRVHSWSMRYAEGQLLNYRQASDQVLQLLYPNPVRVRDWAPQLEQRGLGPFAGRQPPGNH